MALPSSGQISVSDIRTELSNTGKTNNYNLAFAGAPYGLARDVGYVPLNQSSTSKPNTSAAASATPRSSSFWYSYDHTAQLTCPLSFETPNVTGGNYVYYKTSISGTSGTYTPIYASIANPDGYSYTVRIYDSYPFNNLGEITATAIYIGAPNQVFWYQLPSTTNVLHFVFWNTSVA